MQAALLHTVPQFMVSLKVGCARGELGGIDLGREIRVLGFNHNIQGSRGITSEVRHLIRNWFTDTLGDIFPDDQEN